jgi:hypothetical protein
MLTMWHESLLSEVRQLSRVKDSRVPMVSMPLVADTLNKER